MSVEIATKRFILRELSANDVTSQYLGWLQDVDAKKYITAASHTSCLSDLKQYVCSRIGREDILFLGIFDKSTGLHIGNIKYEPVNSALGFAVMGILIGNITRDFKCKQLDIKNNQGHFFVKEHITDSSAAIEVFS
ncbi:MAG: hypothetical protein RBT37_00480 [Dissulfurispiraceae bacterium]|jgi:hypothetical protein|nr:hypothetical protein [Dissulfurispiraceae bacterium]